MSTTPTTTRSQQLRAKLESGSLSATNWIGSIESLVLHTAVFILAFASVLLGISFDRVLLVLTTVLSLEAIYLAIFIQMSVNRNTMQLRQVEEEIVEIAEDVEGIEQDVDEIQKDVDEIQDDVEDIAEGVEEMEKDIDEIQKDVDEIQDDVEDIAEGVEEMEKDIDEIQKDVDEIQDDVEDIAEEVEERHGGPLEKLEKESQ